MYQIVKNDVLLSYDYQFDNYWQFNQITQNWNIFFKKGKNERSLIVWTSHKVSFTVSPFTPNLADKQPGPVYLPAPDPSQQLTQI